MSLGMGELGGLPNPAHLEAQLPPLFWPHRPEKVSVGGKSLHHSESLPKPGFCQREAWR